MDATATTQHPGDVDFLDYFLNPDRLSDFVDATGAAITFTPELDLPILPPVVDVQSIAEQDSLVYIKEEPYSPGQSSDSGYGGDEFETVKQEVNTQPLHQSFANETVESCTNSGKTRRTGSKRSRESQASQSPTLSAEQMRKLSNGASIVGDTNGNKSLTVDEERQIKRQRRLIKNRESAQKSRQRRKMYIEELEKKVNSLASQNERLHQENKILRDDLEYLSNVLKKTSNLPGQLLGKPVAGATPRSVQAAGMCLLIVLFSFGLFFNAKNGPHGVSLPLDPSLPREPVPEVLLPTVSDGFDKRYATRMLKSIKESAPEEKLNTNTVSELFLFPEQSSSKHSTATLLSENSKDEPFIIQDDPETLPPSSSPSSFSPSVNELPCIKKADNDWANTPIVMDLSSDEDSNVTETSTVALQERPETDVVVTPSTRSYIFCSEVEEIPTEEGSFLSGPTISFVLPIEAFTDSDSLPVLSSSSASLPPAPPPGFVEVFSMNIYAPTPIGAASGS